MKLNLTTSLNRRGQTTLIALRICSFLLFTFIFVSPGFSTTLATVNHAPISDTAVKEALQSYLRQIGHKKLSSVRMASLQKTLLKKLIEEEILYQEGIKKGLLISEEEIERGINTIRNRFQSSGTFKKALSRKSLTLDDIKNGVARSILIQKTWEDLSQLTETDRTDRLKKMVTQSEIQIYNSATSAADDLPTHDE